MQKEKIKRTFEVAYMDGSIRTVVPVTAEDFRIRDNFLVFSIDNEDVIAFKEWIFVRKAERASPIAPPSEFTKRQLELTKNSPLLKKH